MHRKLNFNWFNKIHYGVDFLKDVYIFTGTALHCGVHASHCSGPSCFGAQTLVARASVVAANGLSCFMASGIIPDQGSNLCPLQCNVDS